ncbi:MAG: signal peptidase I [Armatimonadota bacterium]|nr:signal peptidase I [Armatimonadota bacterium]MDR7422073.1 signal peptidase I [Armatimonadota bacterium]MDR7454137.1 signal peptidase I [Armatimonadota bacterium]MDR7456236.1 signal peptidase I [Armatimonadota bacterium]MDR7496896.1 signal peptidase I [Armatimonadota bacterium]
MPDALRPLVEWAAERLPLGIPTLILGFALFLVVLRAVVRRLYALSPRVRLSIVETLDATIFAALLSLVIIVFVVQAFFIPSGSMEPTLRTGDRILVGKFTYRFWEIRRGDIIVFRYPLNPNKDFVKRVIGLPGERVEMKDGLVLIDGRPLSEVYPTALPGGDHACRSNYAPVVVPEGSVFVLGDNRCNSEDSRFFGFVPKQNIVGRALAVYWPPDRIGLPR